MGVKVGRFDISRELLGELEGDLGALPWPEGIRVLWAEDHPRWSSCKRVYVTHDDLPEVEDEAHATELCPTFKLVFVGTGYETRFDNWGIPAGNSD